MRLFAGRFFYSSFNLRCSYFFFVNSWKTGPMNFSSFESGSSVIHRSHFTIMPSWIEHRRQFKMLIGSIEHSAIGVCCKYIFTKCVYDFVYDFPIEYRYRCEQEAKSIWKRQSVSMRLMWGKCKYIQKKSKATHVSHSCGLVDGVFRALCCWTSKRVYKQFLCTQ